VIISKFIRMSFGSNPATVTLVSLEVKARRRYESTLRSEQSVRTRQRIVESATRLFTSKGYVGTSVSQIASEAGVALDTVYALVGRKPALMRQVVELAISGGPSPVTAEERPYVQEIRAAATAASKLEIYAAAIVEMSPRTAPVFTALHDAGRTDQDCAALYAEIDGRRAENMLRFAADLRSTGELRPELDDRFVADVVWATAGAPHYAQLLGRPTWTPERFGRYLSDLWARLFLVG
jgi:AcrR family transcriptional regulator